MFSGTCVRDDTLNRVLTGAFREFQDDPKLTPEICRDWCSEQGDYELFGLENGNQCFCGDTFRYPLEIVNSGDCHMKCPGDVSKTCGGYFRLEMWSKQKSLNYHTNILLDTDSNQYIGQCFADDPSFRILQDYYYRSDDMTREQCRDTCSEGNYKYYGVENGDTCYCGQRIHGNLVDAGDNC